MDNKIKSLVLLVFFSFILGRLTAQCDQIQTLVICDMETIDFDANGTPDGIIDLYVYTGVTPQTGDVWSSTGLEDINDGLEVNTGILRLWKLRKASSDYQFTLQTTACLPNNRMVVNLTLGPFAGVPVTIGFFPACDDEDYCDDKITIDLDLFDTLESREGQAPPHTNGVWTYTGSLPDTEYNLGIRNFGASIAATPEDGSPIDSDDFTFTYTVTGESGCITDQTDVRVTIVRPSFPGYGSEYNICLADDSWDRVINLYDDEFLVSEETGGNWQYVVDEPSNISISNQINLKTFIDDFLNSPDFMPNFGCKEFEFRYVIDSRAPVCEAGVESVKFTVFEDIKAFEQEDSPEQICPATDDRTELDLYDLITFQPNYEYKNAIEEVESVEWSFEGGPSDLDLVQNVAALEIPEKHRGPVNLEGASPGIYEFRYTVKTDTLCASFTPQRLVDPIDNCMVSVTSENPCGENSAAVILEIFGLAYAGDDTTLNLCTTNNTGEVSLRSLLDTNGTTTVQAGVWTDANTSQVVPDLFTFPENVTDPVTYSFIHSVSDSSSCNDEAALTFTIFKESDAGINADINICSNNLSLILFDQLGGNPDTSGTWFGPFGYTSTDHLGVFDPNDDTLPILGPGQYVYSVPGNDGCDATRQATVTITFQDSVNLGADRFATYCKTEGNVNLFSLLDNDTPRIGTFSDTDPPTNALSAEGILNFESLTNGIYDFRYAVLGIAPCDEESLIVSIQIVDVPEPVIPDTVFCILDGVFLKDIIVYTSELDGNGDPILEEATDYNWYTSNLPDAIPLSAQEIESTVLFDDQIFYVSIVDSNNCESERVEIVFTILNTGERLSSTEFCSLDFQDGVSPDGNGQNDTFSLVNETFNIPAAFPDFKLNIYNRYGTLVYEANANTEEFSGQSNVSLSNGGDLPSGTYFYVFEPNFKDNLPIQGSFYLSR